jgi:hypothetical protein
LIHEHIVQRLVKKVVSKVNRFFAGAGGTGGGGIKAGR